MIPVINKVKTGKMIQLYMKMRGLSVQDVADSLSLGCVQSVYHWLSGQSLPSLDNLYALSRMLDVPMDVLVCSDTPHDRRCGSSGQVDRAGFYCAAVMCAGL
jgi:transcriptional regulator with XRE-family HTH domain